jgi:hypothetical protein
MRRDVSRVAGAGLGQAIGCVHCLVLANVPFQMPASCPPEAFDVAGALEVAVLVITAEALVLAGEELALAVDPFPLPDELHAAVSSMQP